MERRRKKIKFPLEMKDGVKVRELDDLREHFDLEKAVGYFCSGKLQTWLDNVYASEIVEELNSLTGEEEDFVEKFTDALGVNCDEEIDVRKIIHDAFLKEKLKRFYPEEQMGEIVGNTADTQEIFEQLVKEGHKKIYLLSGIFSIPKSMRRVSLIGLDSPKVIIKAQTVEEFQKKNIELKDILPADEETEKIMFHEELSISAKGLLDILDAYLQKISQGGEIC